MPKKSKKTQAERASAERLRLLRLLNSVPDSRRKLLESIVENVAWMRVKLDAARDEIADTSIVTTYDNGGNQKGIHENPAFRGYESLWKAYMQGMDKILNALPAEERRGRTNTSEPDAEPAKPQTVLELVRAKHAREA